MTNPKPPAGAEPPPWPEGYRPGGHRLPRFVNAELLSFAGSHGTRVHLQPYTDGGAYLSITEQRERASGVMVDHSAAGYVPPQVLAQLVALALEAAAAAAPAPAPAQVQQLRSDMARHDHLRLSTTHDDPEGA